MIRSNSDTTTTTASTGSPTPVSPFSSDYSVPSEPTSDETPDLGAFTAVLRAWTSLQPPLRTVNSTLVQQANTSIPSRSLATTSSSDLREDKSTVWSHRPIANYLSLSDPVTTDAESTDRDRPRMVQIQDVDDELDNLYDHDDTNDDNDHDDSDEQLRVQDLGLHDLEEQPSLGYLDEALKFIAAERELLAAQRETGAAANTIDSHRKRRRKRNKTPRAQSTTRTPIVTSPSISTISASTILADVRDDVDDADALGVYADDSSSSVDQQSSPSLTRASTKSAVFNSTPGTPLRRARGRSRKLVHSRSTPQLRLIRHEEEEDDEDEDESTDSVTEDSLRVKQLKLLGKKLDALFPEDREYLKKVRYRTMSPPPAASGPHQASGPAGYFDPADSENNSKNVVLGGFVDTRGEPPKKTAKNNERLIHVFVDHSNILIGLLNYLRRYPRQHPQYRGSFYPNSPSQSSSSTTGSFVLPLPGSSPHPFSSPYPKPPKHLSHSALSLILERGRPITRRILVTSSPLYQPMDGAESLGFEVRIFARVPDMGDGMDREKSNNLGNSKHKKSRSNDSTGAPGNLSSPVGNSSSSQSQRRRAGSMNNNNNSIDYNHENNTSSFLRAGRKNVHSRKISGNSSTESEQNGRIGGLSPGFLRNSAHLYSQSLPTSHTSTPPPFTTHNSTSSLDPAAVITPSPAQQQRIRYREQGVDELLQLKLHQVLASIDGPPPKGSTIILATGDGNVGQFNEDGFLGGVRTALKRGWKVELYAWEGGLSRAWKREFGEGSEWASSRKSNKKSNGKTSAADDDGPRFRVIGIEQFGSELVEIYY
ncbi:hypothetical protein GGU10DRAFT_13027 [Lentinula aff. detonsa]|uniref:NYN domain-containing protein n=1 Tax=Lentinula aff. detonsa TaxID=2804958 RepID=A0AA38KQ13_9AGAR|nr:hypothetical protein GGU10DRAFT_13027 [Lentinula aff. detonsa]